VLGGITSAIGKTYLDEVYDLATSEVRPIGARELFNQIIHSFFFVLASSDVDETPTGPRATS
jgi:hypothetical protein